jgi:hypothetical protein
MLVVWCRLYAVRLREGSLEMVLGSCCIADEMTGVGEGSRFIAGLIGSMA